MSFFDHYALPPTTKFGDWIVRRTKQREFNLISPFIPDRSSCILEIGPGKGELAELLIGSGYLNYLAVEPNNVMRQQLEERGIETKNYLIPHLQEGDDTYDAIILSDVFEHLREGVDPELFVSEAKRVLRAHGCLFILAPDFLHWRADFFNSDYTHTNISTVRRTMQLLYNNGFQTLKYEYLSGFFAGWFASLTSRFASIVLWFANSNGIDKKFYKLKLAFLRRFFIVGKLLVK